MERGEMEEIKRHFGVVAEGLRSEMRQIAEGVTNMDEKLERFRREVQEEFKEVKAMINFPTPSWIAALPPSRARWYR